jgi:hypothetical protein
MIMIDEFEAAHMSEMQFLRECYERNFTYQDYVTNCELLKRTAMSKRMFQGHIDRFITIDANEANK